MPGSTRRLLTDWDRKVWISSILSSAKFWRVNRSGVPEPSRKRSAGHNMAREGRGLRPPPMIDGNPLICRESHHVMPPETHGFSRGRMGITYLSDMFLDNQV